MTPSPDRSVRRGTAVPPIPPAFPLRCPPFVILSPVRNDATRIAGKRITFRPVPHMARSKTELEAIDIVRRYNDAFVRGDLKTLEQLVDEDIEVHNPAPMEPTHGRQAFLETVRQLRQAFPDMALVEEDVLASGDRVATRWSVTGTHKGAFGDLEPTNKRIRVSGIEIDRIEDGKVVESWQNFDSLGFMQQIGAVPASK